MRMGGNFNKYLRAVVQSMYKDGKIVEVEHVAGCSVNFEVNALLKLLVQLVMTTEYFKPETKAVLQGNSYRTSGDASVNICTVKSRVTYNFNRLSRVLGDDFFEKILYNRNVDVSSYMNKIKQLLEEFSNKSVLGTLQLKIPECSGKEIDYICIEDWMFLLGVFAWYSKQTKQRTEKQLTVDMVDYIKYLECHADSLNEIQQKHYDLLQKFK